uniref:Uncharacterized protein n=1 Tax=Trichuris muris TaxID=70415 RepID=A0A5S6R4I6_TRIMR
MNSFLVLLLLTSLAGVAISGRRVKRFAPSAQLCTSCPQGDFGCITRCDPTEMTWRGPCHLCVPGDWRCLKFCRLPPYPIPPFCDTCPLTNYMCLAQCIPRSNHPRVCCHTCELGNIICLKTCVYCQPNNPWPCYQCSNDNNQFCQQHCGTRPPCSQCYDWDPDYVRCLRVCIPDQKSAHHPFGAFGKSRPAQCNVDVWGSWCADTWFQGLSQTERAALLRQVMFRYDYPSPSFHHQNLHSRVILMPTI